MAIDTFFANQCKEDSQPILRFYGWDPYCLSLGYHQKEALINYSKLKMDGIHLVKRPTGGRAILHAAELTYSIVIHRSKIHHRDLYYSIHTIFKKALNALGYAVEMIKTPEPLPGLGHEAEDFP